MRWDAYIACGVLFGALLACGDKPRAASWRPSSSEAKPIAKRAVLVEEGDLETLRDAGGHTSGTMTYRDAEFTIGAITDYAADEAAEFGGTHYMLGTLNESSEVTGYVGTKSFGDTVIVSPRTKRTKVVTFLVIRVPRAGWDNLPPALTPKPID